MGTESTLGKDSLIHNPDVILREEDPDGALLFNPDTNQIRVINGTGLFIWKHCDGKKDLPAIVTAMIESFNGVPEAKVANQIESFLDDMKVNGFIRISRGKASRQRAGKIRRKSQEWKKPI